MNNNKIVILCPEIVPMDNKGEEAIIRGVMDTLGLNDQNCEYHIIDPSVNNMVVKRGLYLHPSDLFFQNWRTKEFGLGFSFERIYSSFCSILRHLIYNLYPQWVKQKPAVVSKLIKYLLAQKSDNYKLIPKRYQKSVEYLSRVDYIIAGHNGGLNENVCHVLLVLLSLNIKYTIFGSCMKPNIKQKDFLDLFHEVFRKSDNVIVRNPIAYRWVERYFDDITPILAPDPAFGMNNISAKECDSLISTLGLNEFFKKDVLLFTTAEPAPISRLSFDKSKGRLAKIKAHRMFLASFLKELTEKYSFNILFLPHTIGPTENMDDRKIAQDILSIAKLKNGINERCFVLDADLSAAELKGLIGKGTILIAERIHSIIGAVGVHTPAMCLASDKDTRVIGMLKEMAGLGDNIYYLNNPRINDCISQFSHIYSNIEREKEKMAAIDASFKKQLREISMSINLIQQTNNLSYTKQSLHIK